MGVFRCLLLTAAMLFSLLARAALDISVLDTTWSLQLDNRSMVTGIEPRLEELGFMRRVNTLLATGDYQTVLHAFSERELEGDSVALLNLHGQVLLLEKQFQQAELVLKMALNQQEDNGAAHKSLAILYMQTQSFEQAREHLQKAITLGMNDAQGYGQLAYVNLKLNYAASAVYGYQQALYLQPDNYQWQQGLLYALVQSSAVEQALSLLDEMQAQGAERVDLWYLRSQLFMQKQDYEAALHALEISFRLTEGNCTGVNSAIELHFKLHSNSRAAQLYEACADENKLAQNGFDKKMLNQYLPWLIQQGDRLAANKILSILAKQDLSFVEQSNLALQHAKLSQITDEKQMVMDWLVEAVELNASNAEALLLLANCYAERDEYEMAKLYVLRAQQVDGYEEQALLALAQIHINANDYEPALQSMQRVLELNPSRKDVAHNIRIVKSLLRG